MNDAPPERYACCLPCGYMMAWEQHSSLRVAVPCPRCRTPDQFGPGVFVDDFEGVTFAEALRRAESKRVKT